MSQNARTWINLLVGLLTVLLIILLAPAPIYKARGILLPTQNARTPISPDSVIVTTTRPYMGKVMGYINIENRYPMPGNQAQTQVREYAQALAAKVGANVIVVNSFGVAGVTGSNYIWVLRATAYYAPQARQANLESTTYDY